MRYVFSTHVTWLCESIIPRFVLSSFFQFSINSSSNRFNSTTTLTPPVVWAQRKDKLFVAIQVPEIKGEKVELTEDKLSFTGSANGKNYHIDLEFYAPVSVEVNTVVDF